MYMPPSKRDAVKNGVRKRIPESAQSVGRKEENCSIWETPPHSREKRGGLAVPSRVTLGTVGGARAFPECHTLVNVTAF